MLHAYRYYYHHYSFTTTTHLFILLQFYTTTLHLYLHYTCIYYQTVKKWYTPVYY